jgi:5'-nucleotidase
MVICLSHLGLEYASDKISDVRLAQSLSGIDLILGGHTHTFMEKPYIIKGPGNWETLIHQVGWSGIILGRLDFTFSRNLNKTLALSTSVEVSEKSISG